METKQLEKKAQRATEDDELEAVIIDESEIIAEADAMLDAIEAVLETNSALLPEKKAYSLADAIREGCKLAPQAFSSFKNAKGETCALQSALDAIKAKGLA